MYEDEGPFLELHLSESCVMGEYIAFYIDEYMCWFVFFSVIVNEKVKYVSRDAREPVKVLCWWLQYS